MAVTMTSIGGRYRDRYESGQNQNPRRGTYTRSRLRANWEQWLL